MLFFYAIFACKIINMRKSLILIIVLLYLIPINIYSQSKITREKYIDTYKDIAIKQMRSHGIPASITLAQGCLESGDGNSRLAVKGNNHFGIKCHDWKGPTIRQNDDKRKECFRKYRHAEASYKDHADFLRYRDRYAFLFELEPTDYKAWAYGLKKAGYATDPKYAIRLIKIIEDNELYKYDTKLASKEKIRKYTPPTPSHLESLKEYKPAKASKFYRYSQIRTLYKRNRCTYILAGPNDTYAGIAKEYNLFKKELLRFNDLKKDSPIKSGTIVYLELKASRASKHLDVHIAEGNETYYEISQRYAIRLDRIFELNDIPKDKKKPTKNDTIFLRKYKTIKIF